MRLAAAGPRDRTAPRVVRHRTGTGECYRPGMTRLLPPALLVALTSLACGLSGAEPEGVAVSECACSCACTDESCACTCACDGVEVPTELTVAERATPPDRDGSSGDTAVEERHHRIGSDALQAMLEDPDEITRSVRIVPHFRNGVPGGVKLYGIRPGSPLDAVGFRNGDLVRTVGGHPIDDAAGALEAYASLRGTSRVEVGITRRGREELLVIEVE